MAKITYTVVGSQNEPLVIGSLRIIRDGVRRPITVEEDSQDDVLLARAVQLGLISIVDTKGIETNPYPVSGNLKIGAHSAFPMARIAWANQGTSCHHLVQVLPFAWDAISLTVIHTGTTDGKPVKAAFAVSDTLARSETIPELAGVQFTGLGHPGFRPIAWGGSATSPVITAPGASAIAAGPWSDWLEAASVARTDGAGYIAMLRTYCTSDSNSRHSASVAADFTGWSPATAASQGVGYVGSWLQAVDGVANPAAYTSPAKTQHILGHALRFQRRGRSIPAILYAGDSRFQTNGATVSGLNAGYNELSSIPHMTQWELAARGVASTVIQCGWSGSKSSEYIEVAKRQIDMLAPAALCYMVHTVNDTVSGPDFQPATVDAQLTRANEVKAYCEARGVRFVPLCHYPKGSTAWLSWQFTEAQRIRDWCAANATYVDPSALVGNSDGTWRAEIGNDGTHGGALARRLIAVDLARAVAPYV